MLEPFVRKNLPRLQHLYDRVPAPGRHLLASARGWVLTQIRYSPETFAILRELWSHESWSPDDISAYQLRMLQKIWEYAFRTVPFYSRYPRIEIRALDDLRRLPVLDREKVLENQPLLLSRAIPERRKICAATTGTTGTSLRVVYTEDLARHNWAFLLRQRAWADIAFRQWRITLQGSRIVPANRDSPPYWTYNFPERQVLLSIFHLSEKTAPDYLSFLRRRIGRVLEGFPSVLGMLADFVLACRSRIPMRVVFTSGEPLYPWLRTKIEDAFGTRVFDTYGMTEYCGLIQECEQGGMHLAPEYGFLEILDGCDCPVSPGEEGDLVWTGFLNAAMPLVRYRIGDRGRWQPGNTCACGRAFPLVVPTITRESDTLRCPDGRLFSARALNQLLKHSDALQSCQFVHDQPARVRIRAVARGAAATQEIEKIRRELCHLLGNSMNVVAEIAFAPLTRSGGKIPLIVNQVRQ